LEKKGNRGFRPFMPTRRATPRTRPPPSSGPTAASSQVRPSGHGRSSRSHPGPPGREPPRPGYPPPPAFPGGAWHSGRASSCSYTTTPCLGGVRGPVDLRALRRLAARNASVRVGDLRSIRLSFIARPSFIRTSHEPSDALYFNEQWDKCQGNYRWAKSNLAKRATREPTCGLLTPLRQGTFR
jgi:hypothetical protein